MKYWSFFANNHDKRSIEVLMKESFGELYTRLYKENFKELEALRHVEKKYNLGIILTFAAMFILPIINPLFIFLIIIGIIIWGIRAYKAWMKGEYITQTKGNTYEEVFKEKIVGPIIEHTFESAKYNAKQGLDRHEYNKAGYNERINRYFSDDLIIAPLKSDNKISTFISFAEVHTQLETKDADGDKSCVTVFQGLAGSFLIPQNVGRKIYIRSNGRVSGWNKNKVKMDMPEFEKIFDVESDDPILTMRILTADVMTEMIDLYQKYKYSFEVHIINDTVYMRLRTGRMFEPNVFKSSMEYKQLEKYYMVLKALTNISEHIYNTILKLEV